MRNSGTFSVLFQPRFEKESKGKTLLYIRINANDKRTRFSLKRNFTTALWDPTKTRLKGSSIEAQQINAFLDQVFLGVHEAYGQLLKEKKLITPHTVMARFRGEDQIHKTLLQLSAYHNLNMKSVLKPGTLKNYYTTEKYLKKFLQIERKIDDIYLENLNYAFIIDFENFLRNNVAQLQSRPLTNNGLMKHLERLKKLLNLAQKLEWITRDPFVKFSLKFIKIEREYLSQSEVDKVYQANFKNNSLNKTKDIFIFACYTGLSYIDVKKLVKNHIVIGIDGNKWIYTRRQKTDQVVKIPLLDPAAYIVDKYKDEMTTDNRLLPVYSNQKINEYLKKIASKLKIHKNVTFHCARHTFATTITLSNGVPIETVSKLLGHTKLSTTQIYARVLESRISDDIGNLKNILYQQEKMKNKKIK
ncbi:site-specific integrase [Aequorivita marina]|uniref:site-specific integrase n=1 Tax=Aequorivita marina TaxID=3073654 RepID=UPI002875EA33|nr:site-specific integrase [Aequorivita sp. S2608]MDS1297870.1 site-specific integrase [Aequorivita sp. S2608]